MSEKIPHLWHLGFKPDAKHALDDLPKSTRKTVFRHLEELLKADDPYTLNFVEMLKEKRFERARRFRAGNHRVLFILNVAPVIHENFEYKGTLVVLTIDDRKNVY